ncbi:MAG TPA: HAD-IIA family hydrolase [Spirochaetota bacterium]
MPKNIISDMDGVIYRGKELIPGAKLFVKKLLDSKTRFLFLTNNSEQTPLDLKRRLESMGIDGLTEDNFITSAMATAIFLHEQRPHGSAFVIGGAGLTNELYKVGYSITEHAPDYVVVGKTSSFTYQMMKKAVQLIHDGARFIGTNPDLFDPTESGIEPACGAILASIEGATGKKPYIIGKPNALMMTIARKKLDSRSSETVMIGDRMDTDIIAGLEAGMTTCLVLSGVTTRPMVDLFGYRPSLIFDDVGQINPLAL